MIARVLAPNPGLYTGPGTNTYVLADMGEAVVLDPGPVIDGHELAIIDAIGRSRPVGVVVTHSHPDHAPLANRLARRLGVPVYGHAPGPSFEPDIRIGDGDEVAFGGLALAAVHTPGHTPDHLCFLDGPTLFTGDHIMGGSTVVIEDASAYLDSLYKVRAIGATRIEPGHGDPMDDAGAAIDAYIEHRLSRERQIVAAIGAGASTVGDVVDVVYGGIPSELRPAATHQVRVQLAKLSRDGAIGFDDDRTEHSKVRPESG